MPFQHLVQMRGGMSRLRICIGSEKFVVCAELKLFRIQGLGSSHSGCREQRMYMVVAELCIEIHGTPQTLTESQSVSPVARALTALPLSACPAVSVQAPV